MRILPVILGLALVPASWAAPDSPKPRVVCLAKLVYQQREGDLPVGFRTAFLHGPFHHPIHRADLGTVEFKVTTRNPKVQLLINQGIALLHTFWHEEAEACFRHAASIEPGCAMAYWGLAVANENRLDRAAFFMAEAIKAQNPFQSQREKSWIAAWAPFFAKAKLNGHEDRLRRRALVRQLEQIVATDPGQLEARAFLVRQVLLNEAQARMTVASRLGVEELTGKIREQQPDHPSSHYLVFNWLEQPQPRLARMLKGYAQTAPGVADRWQYAGAYLESIGEYRLAEQAQRAALRVNHADLIRTFRPPWRAQNLDANYRTLAMNLARQGRFKEARAIGRQFDQLPKSPNSIEKLSALSLEMFAGQHQVGPVSGWSLGEAKGQLENHPGTFYLTAQYLAHLLEAGRVEEAKALVTKKFRRQAGLADPDLKVLVKLTGWHQDLGLPKKWTLGAPPLPVSSLVPRDPEALGPMTWTPVKAPAWKLPTPDGKQLGSGSFTGKPLLMIFFLGGDCIHCIEQLNVFGPRHAEFKALGIDTVALSIDPVEKTKAALTKSVDGVNPPQPYPFPIVCNPGLDVFKAFKVHDDFENMAMHGTFLVSGDGRILWHEISHEPFMQVDFLLRESKRLVELHEGAAAAP